MDKNRARIAKIVSSAPKITTMKMAYDTVSESLQNEYEHMYDYVRYREIELLKETIISGNVEGSIAEAGVDYGDTSRILNLLFPDRKLFLYDTFNGFESGDAEFESQNYDVLTGFFEKWNNNRPKDDELISIVKEQLCYPEKAFIRKGFFPDTAIENDSDEKFALAVVDMDLYKPCYSAIMFFYPRLSDGGYIMLHDYNTPYFHGIHNALINAEKKLGKLAYIPLPDQGGSVVIVKK